MINDWREVVITKGKLPPPLADALLLAQVRAHGARLPMVLVGDALIIDADDFTAWCGKLQPQRENVQQGAQRR